jgi:hypothetical protein
MWTPTVGEDAMKGRYIVKVLSIDDKRGTGAAVRFPDGSLAVVRLADLRPLRRTNEEIIEAAWDEFAPMMEKRPHVTRTAFDKAILAAIEEATSRE